MQKLLIHHWFVFPWQFGLTFFKKTRVFPGQIDIKGFKKFIQGQESKEEQYHSLLKTFVKIEEADNKCINDTLQAVAEGSIHELEISSMLLVNRLFTQACRLQIFSLKDLLLTHEQINNFDRALDMKEIIEEEKGKQA